MNILSTQQMKQMQTKLLRMPIPPNFQLKVPNFSQSTPTSTLHTSILALATQSTQIDIRKVVSLADNIRYIALSDPNSVLKVFTMAIISIVYQSRPRKKEGSDGLLLDSLKCSLYSPDVALTSIKESPINQSSNQVKTLLASFFELVASKQSNLSIDTFKIAEMILQENQQLLGCFILFFRSILVTLEVEGASSWRGIMNGKTCLQHLLDYFDISSREVGELFLLYEQGVFLAVREKEVLLGDYFENEGERQNQMKQMEIKQSIKLNMIQSLLLSVNHEEAAQMKKGIVDSDIKLFNFILQSTPDEVRSHPDTETPHFKANQQLQFGKKKNDEGAITYHPQEVRFQLQKLINDESLEEIEPEDLINFNAQFDDSPSIKGVGHLQDILQGINILDQKIFTPLTLPKPPNLITLSKKRKSWVDKPYSKSSLSPPNRLKKANTEIRIEPRAHLNQNFLNLGMCLCREVRMSRNFCVSKVVDFSFVPPNRHRRSPIKSFLPGSISFKNGRTVTEQKSYTLNKEKSTEKKSLMGEERTPSFLKNLKKQNSLQSNHKTALPQAEQVFPSSSKEIAFRQRYATYEQRNSGFLVGPSFLDEGLNKMNISDSQPTSSKKFEHFGASNRGQMAQSSSILQTNSNFNHQRHATTTSPLNQSNKVIPQPPSKSSSPLKFFAPVQIIAPTVYVDSNGNDKNSNTVHKLSDRNEKAQKITRVHNQSTYPNRFQLGGNEGLEAII